MPPEQSGRAAILDEIDRAYQTQHEQRDSPFFLDASIKVKEEALQMTPKSNHRDYYPRLDALRVALKTRYERMGRIEDLNRTISIAIEILSKPGLVNFIKIYVLNDLGCNLASRYCLTGSTDDLNAAITAHENCISFSMKEPDHYKHQGMYLHNLGCSLGTRYKRTNNLEDLSRAISVIGQSIRSLLVDECERVHRLNSLAIVLEYRYKHTGSIEDLKRAIKFGEAVVDSINEDASDRPWYLANLSQYFFTLFDDSDSLVDLNKAISFMELAVESTPKDHPRRPAQLKTFGCIIARRYLRTAAPEDLRAAIRAFESAVYTSSGPPTDRVEAGALAASFLTNTAIPDSERDIVRASRILQYVIHLLPSISPRTLLRDDQLHELSRFAGLATKTTALGIETGSSAYEALELLEIGRGITTSLLLDTRTDIAALERAHPDIAHQFNKLRDQLDSPIYGANTSPFNNSNSPEGLYCSIWRHEAARQFQTTLEHIRSLDQFDKFLLCPSQSELIDLASNGPIVVLNIAAERSDAMLIRESGITYVHLGALCERDVKERSNAFLKSLSDFNATKYNRCNKELLDLLEWLWDVMVNRILEELGFTRIPKDGNAWPHVWWCPTGWMSTLPIHAAGYRRGHPARNALNRIISSYIPSLKSLASARKHTTCNTPTITLKTLLIQMPVTPNFTNLDNVVKEINAVAEVIPSSISRRILDCPTKSEVLSDLQSCDVIHFACHAKESPNNPSQSRLLLKDWEEDPLTVADLVALKHKRARFAYLSACNTAANGVEALLDENIQIASAFQLAGFPHVVGTLWQIQDSYSVEIAQAVYKAMYSNEMGFDTTNAPVGLHRVVRDLRNRKSREHGLSRELWKEPLIWAPYIHIGL